MSWPDRTMTTAELHEAIVLLENISDENGRSGERMIVFPLCPHCHCPYNIPSHPERCEGGLALTSVAHTVLPEPTDAD